MTPPFLAPSVLMVAAEESSALYATRLLEYWKRQGQEQRSGPEPRQNIQAFGVGNQAMEALGFQVLSRSEDLAIFGLFEVLSHRSIIKKTFQALLKEAKERKPKVALLLDYSSFNLRLALRLKEMGIPVVYYISPKIWVWKKRRMQRIKQVVDKMLVLFSFERDIYESHGVPVSFVGHPLLDEIDEKLLSSENRQIQRQRYGLKPQDKFLGLMPGSRYSELKYNLEIQLQVARQLVKEDPQLKVGLLVAPPFATSEIKERIPNIDFPLSIVKDNPFEMLSMADGVLCASGTATLFVGLMKKPLVIMYKLHPMTAWLLKRMVKVKYVGMVNIVLNQEVGEEYLQERANFSNLHRATRKILYDKDYIQLSQSVLARLSSQLGDKGATARVARELEEFLR